MNHLNRQYRMNDVYKLLTNAENHRKEDIDCAINGLKQEAETINKFIRYTERGWALLEEKLNKRRLVALAALSKSKVLINKMELQIAESEFNKENQQNTLKIISDSDDQGNKSSVKKKLRGRHSATKLTSRQQRSPNSSRSRYNTRSQNNSYTIKETSTSEQANFKPDAARDSNIKSENPVTQCSVSSTTLTDSNRNLTASIIAEITKQDTKINDLPKSAITTNNTAPTLNNLPQKRKIYPVSNIEAYKKPYTHHSLSYGSHVLYNPITDVKKPLHPGDPRTYYYKTDSKVKQPMRLSVPQMSGLDPTQSIRKPGVYIPQCTPVQNTAISTTRKDQLPVTSQHQNWQQINVPVVNTTNKYDTYAPVPFTQKQGLNICKYSVDTSKKLECNINKNEDNPLNKVENIDQTVIDKVERKNMGNLTPPQQQVNKRKKHICVPTPPLYCNSRRFYSGNTRNLN